MTRRRLWQVIGFLALVAMIFVVTTIRDEVRALREDRAEQTDPALATPLLTRRPPNTAVRPNSQRRRVMVVSQAIQVVFFTAGLFAFFLALGIIAIPDDVAVLWSAETNLSGGPTALCRNVVRYPHPDPADVVQTSLFVAVLSGLYFTVSTSTDPLYRQRFFEPLIADVAVSLAGRDAYLDIERAQS